MTVSFDRRVARVPGWAVTNPVPVVVGETRVGLAVLSLTEDPKQFQATIYLDGEDDPWPDGVRLGVSGTVVKSHVDADGVSVVDEVAVKAIVVG